VLGQLDVVRDDYVGRGESMGGAPVDLRGLVDHQVQIAFVGDELHVLKLIFYCAHFQVLERA
jgi:hypothetical protein